MQRTLTFSRDERLLLIAAAALPTSRVKSRRLKALLYHLETTSGREGCFPAQETLAAKMGVTDRTIRNMIALANEIGLLTTDRRGRRQLSYFVEWAALRRFCTPADLQQIAEAVATDDRGRRARALVRSLRARGGDANDPQFFSAVDQNFPVDTGNSFRSTPETVSALPIKGHYIPPEAPADSIDEWIEAEAAVFAAGVDHAEKAIAAAKAAGVSALEVRQAVDHFASLAGVGPAALFCKLARMRPGEPVDRRWPKPAAATAGVDVVAATVRATIATWSELDADEAAHEAEKRRQAAAAAAIAPQIDALPEADREALRDRLFARLPFLRDRWRRNPACGLVRENLIAQFAREAAE